MRLIFIISQIIFFANITWACPELTGIYVCGEESQIEEIKIEQEIVEGATIYALTDDDGLDHVPVNNYAYTFKDSENGMSGTVRYACENNSFITYTVGQIVMNGIVVRTWNIAQSLALSPSGELNRTIVGENIQNGDTERIHQAQTCTRK